MEIYKFGGVSIKDADGVRRIARIVRDNGLKNGVIVISAMGKMTNAFEELVSAYLGQKPELPKLVEEIKNYHFRITNDLFEDSNHPVYDGLNQHFDVLQAFMTENTSADYDYIYDQVVSVAELISSTIVSAYFNETGIDNSLLDVRECIRTNNRYRGASVDWGLTASNVRANVASGELYVTQGFIARGSDGSVTTLGREGSDYTGAIFAYCLDADSQTIWKDVAGVMNADPRKFKDPVLLDRISYEEAIELAFYGASVIHPKTIQPLQRKSIPLRVRSFNDPSGQGTAICKGIQIEPNIPCFIIKEKQILLSLSTMDFAFIVERNISDIFDVLHRYNMKVNLIQNSTISFLICLEDKYDNFDKVLQSLRSHFEISYEKDVRLYTLRHYSETAIAKTESYGKVLFKQLNTSTAQLVIR